MKAKDRAHYEAVKRKHPEKIAALESALDEIFNRIIASYSPEDRDAIRRGESGEAFDATISIFENVEQWLRQGRLQ